MSGRTGALVMLSACANRNSAANRENRNNQELQP